MNNDDDNDNVVLVDSEHGQQQPSSPLDNANEPQPEDEEQPISSSLPTHPSPGAEAAQQEEEEEDRRRRPHEDDGGLGHYFELIGHAYARNGQHYMACLYSTIPQGLLLPFVALAFFNFYTFLAERTWLTHDYEAALEYTPSTTLLPSFNRTTSHQGEHVEGEGHEQHDEESILEGLQLGQGEWWYIGLLSSAGLAIGLVKTLWSCLRPRHVYPYKTPGFLVDLRELKAHDEWLFLPMLVCSAISIGFGASVGPEAAMGATGTSLGTMLGKRWKIGPYQAKRCRIVTENDTDTDRNEPQTGEGDDDDDQKNDNSTNVKIVSWLPDLSDQADMTVLDGIAAAFGALFPSQYLSPMIIFELGGHWGPGGKFSVTETIARTGLAATIAYIIFVGLEERTLLDQVVLPNAAYDYLPRIEPIHLLYAAILGVICGFVGLFGFVLLALGGAAGKWTNDKIDKLGIRMGLPATLRLGILLSPAIGGSMVGLLCVASPLCLGDGADQLGSLLVLGLSLGTTTIAVTGIIKLACVSLCLGFGFVGGQIFPFVFTGTCVGVVAHLLVDVVPVLVAVPCCMVAVPCAFIPAIFTFTTLASMILALGGAATTPVFFACVISYSTVCGLGIIQDLLVSSVDKTKAKKKPAAAATAETERVK